MNREIRDQWTAALRSGEYIQGSGVLRRKGEDGDTFCCLGVLCDLAEKAGVVERKIRDEGTAYATNSYNGHDAFLPRDVLKWAGLSEEVPSPRAYDEGYTLVYLNDEKGYSFSRIAEVIEANF